MPWESLPDALGLARFQFAFVATFHFLFPAFTIGLASYLAVLEGLWLWTGREVYLDLFRYWLKVFAVAFAMGVVSGLVMSYQFGTNWSVFADRTGPVLGPVIAARDGVPFLCALGLFLLAYVGLGISMWPMIVPPTVTIWEASAPRTSQAFLLAGAAVLIPTILAYTAYVYWLFRGKVRAGEGYH